MKARLRDALGETVAIDGDARRTFPAPERIAALESFPACPGASSPTCARSPTQRCRAGSTASGCATWRRRTPPPELQELPGVGPLTALGIVLRGAGAPDALAPDEPRLARRGACLPADAPPARDELAALAERWRPFRSWVQMLLRMHLDESQRT